MRFALLTCDPLPEPDPDEAPLLAELRGRGHEAEAVAWDEPGRGFTGFDALLLRAAWDYAGKAAAFADWLGRPDVAPRLWNRPEIVRWNLHKGYLLSLASRGVPIVPTVLLPKGEPADLAGLLAGQSWDGFVIKPAVSAGSARTERFSADGLDGASSFLASWHAEADAIVQPYLRSVEGGAHGRPERAIVWIGGRVSHVVEKSRRFAGDAESVTGRAEATAEEIVFAGRAVGACGFDPLYARVDVMDLPSGEMVLSELELIEPSLYFDLGPGSVSAFADAVERRVREA